MNQCLFCDIAAGAIPADIVYRDEEVLAFRDVNPQAPTHLLVIPREHLASAAEITPAQHPLWGQLLATAQRLAEDTGIDDAGYRIVVNVGPNGGQTIDHLHLHLLGGRAMTWPPG